ncbi:MAG: hypothetical protein IPO98_04615 [Saprospiraceae bacterium]|nr:hypothetical protein [Saprospiraceae bacterium]
MNKQLLLFFILTFNTILEGIVHAQVNADSLFSIIEKSSSDFKKLDSTLLFVINNTDIKKNEERILKSIDSILDDEKISAKDRLNFLSQKGILYQKLSRLKEAEYFFGKAYELYKSQSCIDCNPAFLTNYATIRNNLGNKSEAVNLMFELLEISEKKQDWEVVSNAYYKLGVFYGQIQKYVDAGKYWDKSIEISRKHNYKDLEGSALQSKALMFMLTDKEKAEKLLLESIEFLEKIGNQYLLTNSKKNLGFLYVDSGRFDDARRVYNDVESYFISVGDDVGLARNNADLGFLEIELKNYKKAIAYCKSGVDVLVERGDVNGARDAFECLYYAATEMGDYKSALKYFEQNIAYRDSLNKQEDIEKVTELRKDFEFEREREKTESANILNIEKEKTFQNYLALGILLLSGLLFFAFRAYRIKKKAAETISIQKAEIEKYSQINENLIFSLSHDIKEPMLGVQLLLNKIKSEDAYLQKAAISIGEQVGSINSIVNNLLQLKKASSSNEIETSTPIEIIETVAKVTQALSYRISERNIQIINQLSDSDTLNLPISSKKLYMVTLNLLSNAIKHSPEGAKIEIYSTKDGLFIRDYGEGIDPTILDKIGKEQIDKTDQGSGSGMGLMLVSNVLLGSGLKLHFENVLGGGTLAGLKMDAE